MELGIKNGEDSKMNKFLEEILSQPQSLTDTLTYYNGSEGGKKLNDLCGFIRKENFNQVVFTGMGSSYFVSYAASCLFNSLGIHSYAINASELLYYHFKLITSKSLVVCLSQSGESAEVVKLIEKLPAGIACIGISNEEESSLSSKTKGVLLSLAGKEEMTSTKTYTSMSLLSFILGWNLAGRWDGKKKNEVQKLAGAFESFYSAYANTVSGDISFLGDIDFVQFIGRGPLYSTALQSELMFKEAAKTSSSGALGGEFRHGPMEMVNPLFKSILFAALGSTYDQSVKMAADIVKFNGKVILITNKNPGLDAPNIRTVAIDQPDEYLFSILSILPVQLMVNQLALSKGYEPGNFIHGGKVTFAE
jgi:glucosamine--fructose-6-phosphate aminotransferase (isomerizing)